MAQIKPKSTHTKCFCRPNKFPPSVYRLAFLLVWNWRWVWHICGLAPGLQRLLSHYLESRRDTVSKKLMLFNPSQGPTALGDSR